MSCAVAGRVRLRDHSRAEDDVVDTKTIFIAFAIEDERQRDFLKGQSLSPRAPYEFVDMSVKEP